MKCMILAILGLLFGVIIGIAISITKYGEALYDNRIRYIYLDNSDIIMIDPCSKESTLIYLESMEYNEAKKIKYVYCSTDNISYKVEDDGKRFNLIKIYHSVENDG